MIITLIVTDMVILCKAQSRPTYTQVKLVYYATQFSVQQSCECVQSSDLREVKQGREVSAELSK